MIGVVLAGGLNTRFPYLKGFIEVEGTTIMERNIALLKSVVGEVVISSNEPEHYFRFGMPVIGDVVEPGGPLAGIYSALKYTGADRALAVACDMPFINKGLISYITSIKDGDAVVPIFGGKPQPLPAVYAGSALRAMEDALLSGQRSLRGLLEKIALVRVEEDTVRKMDPEGRSFININTVEDLDRALRPAQGG